MSRSGILDALRNEERSLKSQLVAIQRAIEAIEGAAAPTARRGSKQAVKAVGRRKRAMTEEQRRAVAERYRRDVRMLQQLRQSGVVQRLAAPARKHKARRDRRGRVGADLPRLVQDVDRPAA